VADLRDPWALDEWAVYPTTLHRRLDERRMRRQLGRADAVILNCPEATRTVLARFPELRSHRVATIPNGWDSEDFGLPAVPRRDGAFRIVYVGYAHVDAGTTHRRARLRRRLLGGSTPGLDVLARSHLYLLDAVDTMVAEDPSLAARIEVHLAGAQIAGDARTSGHPVVRSHGYLAHAEAIALMRSADLLFLPMHDLPPGFRARTVPGKTYEYLAAGRPILGALPDGDARDLLGAMRAHLCRPRETACLAKTIRRAVRQPGVREPTSPESLANWERRELTRRLASVFDATLARSPLPRAPEG
jgi:glycosyltransferase involved in cell wall biosynthesis